MTLTDFKASLQNDTPPAGLNRALEALWHAGKGNWDASHDLTQGQDDKDVFWVHAHLHREEGDLSNANYWYGKSGRAMSSKSLQEEWDEIAAALLA